MPLNTNFYILLTLCSLSLVGCSSQSEILPLETNASNQTVFETTNDDSVQRESATTRLAPPLSETQLEDPLYVLENETSINPEFENFEVDNLIEVEDPIATHYQDDDLFIPIDI